MINQPPSGGCVLKLINVKKKFYGTNQPPSGGCVLKLIRPYRPYLFFYQPPSGGCVLKQGYSEGASKGYEPAAFGRLCVETFLSIDDCLKTAPAAFGRLCVETKSVTERIDKRNASRLRAAVC